METLPLSKKQALPFVLLLDPVTGTAAAYTNNYRLITENSSKRLVQFALDHCRQEAAFDRKEHRPDSEWLKLPALAVNDVLDRLKLVWIQRPDGEAPAEDWLAIPSR